MTSSQHCNLSAEHSGSACKLTATGRQLTVEEIRARLNAASENSSRSPSLDRFGAMTSTSKSKSVAPGAIDFNNTPERSMLQLAEAMLAYCQLVVESQRRLMNETLELRETVKHLKTIFDDGNARERRHIDTLTHFPKVLKHLDTQYYLLKDNAKALIRECQEDREKCQAECEAVMNTLQDLETELFSAQSTYHQQATEVEHLQEATRNLRSQNEIFQLRETLRKLEDQNHELENENKLVLRQVEEFQKAYDGVLSDSYGDGGSGFGTARTTLQLTDATGMTQCNRTKLNDLKELVNNLKEQAASEKVKFDEMLGKQRQENEHLKAEAQKLLAQLEGQN